MTVQPPKPGTEARAAFDHFSTQSRAEIPSVVLSERIGTTTAGKALNDAVRVRVYNAGTAGQQFVPDNAKAAQVMGSKAGPRLEQMLGAAAQSVQGLDEVTDLKGSILPKDRSGVAAALVMSYGPELERSLRKDGKAGVKTDKQLDEMWDWSKFGTKFAGAVNADGWITLMPDVARAALTATGAYKPRESEKVRSAKYWATEVPLTNVHEVQHSVTPNGGKLGGSTSKGGWLEEGIANALAEHPRLRRQNQKAAGISIPEFSARMGQKPALDIGWAPYRRPELTKKERAWRDEVVSRNYTASHETLYKLMRYAGVDIAKKADEPKVKQLLQGAPAEDVPLVLADAIIKKHRLDYGMRYEMADFILGAVDRKDPVGDLKDQFLYRRS